MAIPTPVQERPFQSRANAFLGQLRVGPRTSFLFRRECPLTSSHGELSVELAQSNGGPKTRVSLRLIASGEGAPRITAEHLIVSLYGPGNELLDQRSLSNGDGSNSAHGEFEFPSPGHPTGEKVYSFRVQEV